MEEAISFVRKKTQQFNDLYFTFCGMSKTFPLHSFGPAIRNSYSVHIIMEGTGYFMVGNQKYTLHKGQGFIIEPGVSTFYQADETNPWSYLWLGFDGNMVKHYLSSVGLLNGSLTFGIKEIEPFYQMITECLHYQHLTNIEELKLNAITHRFIAALLEQYRFIDESKLMDDENENIPVVLDYLISHYREPITVDSIANALNINRSYLSRIFKQALGLTLKDYLMNLRVIHAENQLSLTKKSIETIAIESGFSNPEVFSKNYKKIKGKSPLAWRKTHSQTMGEIEYDINSLPEVLKRFKVLK